MTTSLRGMVSGTLEVQVLDEGVHSGDSSGVVPSSFRILRHLLDRLEDSATGRLLPQSLHCEIPSERIEQVHATARILGDEVWRRFPWSCGADGGFVLPMTTEPEEALLNRTWRPTLSVTGAEGLPPLSSAGNVLRPRTAFKLSLRLPPLVDAVAASQEIKALLEADAPYNAKVIFKANEGAATGWNAPASEQWLTQALDAASQQYYGAPCGYIGQGGTIPLMSILQKGPVHGLRRAGAEVQRPRPQRIPARALRQEAHRRGGPDDGGDARMISTSDAYANVVAETRHWLNQAVIGLNLCPFAKAVQVKDQIRFAVSDATDAEGVLTDLQDELALLAEADPEKIDTTLLIVPDALDDFLEFNDFEDLSDRLLKRMRLVGELQVATFHPQFQFADTQPDDISNYTNRSPYPILHLLREASIDRAVESFPDAAEIYEKNIDTMNRLGLEGWNKLMTKP